MTKIAVTFPDPERLVVDYLNDLIDEAVSVNVPADWKAGSSNHLQVALDGTFVPDWPATARATIRLVARSTSPTQAKALAMKAQGLLCAHTGGGGIAAVSPLTGVVPTRDPNTKAELASVTCRVTVRSQPIEP